jgi:hypothetical protein
VLARPHARPWLGVDPRFLQQLAPETVLVRLAFVQPSARRRPPLGADLRMPEVDEQDAVARRKDDGTRGDAELSRARA